MPRPPDAVLSAFGATGPPVALPGGQGRTWRAGPVVLKPVDFEPEAAWRASVLATLPTDERFRVARPVAAGDGRWVVAGWEACEHLTGRTDAGRPDDAIRTGIAFHEAVAGLARPSFLDERDDPWTAGDRVAWGAPPGCSPSATRLLEPLLAAGAPVTAPAQVVHGDLGANVLYAEGEPPAVIDWVVYHRPPVWATAVVVADAVCWHGAGDDLVARWSRLPDFGPLLVRALIYRLVTEDRVGRTWTPALRATYERATASALALAG